MNLFADDAKLLRKIEIKEHCEHLQKDLNKIHRWSKLWGLTLEFNVKKCKVLEISCSRMRQRGKYLMGNEWINKTNVEKDLGVWITDNLSPENILIKSRKIHVSC